MIHYYTNREISDKLEVNLSRWKRWSRAFLPPDPLGGQQSGYARQYLFKDLFKVYLGGHLLAHHKLTVAESVGLLADLVPWLKKMGFMDPANGGARLSMAVEAGLPVLVYFVPVPSTDAKSAVGFEYLVHRHSGGRDGTMGHLHVRESGLDGQPVDGSAFFRQPRVHLINVTALYAMLVEMLTP